MKTLQKITLTAIVGLAGSIYATAQTKGDLLITEFLTSPTNLEFIEIYNNTSGPLNLANYKIAERDIKDGSVDQDKTLSGTLAAGDYLALVSTSRDFIDFYNEFGADTTKFLTISGLQGLSPDDGIVITAAGDTGIVIDEFVYDVDKIGGGASFASGIQTNERKFLSEATQDFSNWTKANPTLKGTPGKANSDNFNKTIAEKISGKLTPAFKVFAPKETDPALASVNLGYSFDKVDMIMNIYIFNNAGTMVKHLAKQEVVSTLTGQTNWDGTDEDGNILPTGVYTLVLEAFDDAGNVTQDRVAVAIGAQIR